VPINGAAPIVAAVSGRPVGDDQAPGSGAPAGDEAPMLRLGVDVGGTFTDVVTVDAAGRVITAKVPSTPQDSSIGVIDGWRLLAEPAERVEVFAHGTTVATNALLERRGGRTAVITTAGFRDLIEIGRQNRASLYDLTRHRPSPLVPRELRFVVRERMDPGGVVTPLDTESLAAAVDAVAAAGVDAVAVCLLFGFLYPAHELAVGDALRTRLPGIAVSLSCEVLPEFREYERMATTVADAYLRPRLSEYLRRLQERSAQAGLPEPLVMQSSGGVATAGGAAQHPARFVLSGPAGGVVGASHVAGLSGYPNVLSFDMGGTSTDVAPVVDGRVQLATESVIAGVPLRLPMVDVHTVSAGGGSIAWVDDGGALRVGPRSAGADPGPAAYGRGGVEPTVTDANLLLGALPDGGRLGGGLVLRRELAERALAALGERLGLDASAAALGVVRVADTEMVRALRLISVERGLDPRDFALVAFGGAGGLHACALAEDLGSPTVLVPRAAGVLSALGLAISQVRHDYARPVRGGGHPVKEEDLEAGFTAVETAAVADLDGPVTQRLADLRYAGQSFELTVPGSTAAELEQAFHAEHERRYGYRIDDEPVEIVNLRLVATVPGVVPDLLEHKTQGTDAVVQRRRLLTADGVVDAAVCSRAQMGVGSKVRGPAVVEFADATCLVRPGWSGVIDRVGTLVLTREPAVGESTA
jgi:N-methylhydantoinase A